MVQERIKCRYNLKIKHIVEDDTCPICQSAPETMQHLILECLFAKTVWECMGFDIAGVGVARLWEIPKPVQVPAAHFSVLLLLVSWSIWKHRNGVTFSDHRPSERRLLTMAKEMARLWQYRLPRDDAAVTEIWCSMLFSNM